ncbi:unnamed protein product [Prorocentrum cordatum]|uniref:Guanine nucleotide-binding protein subunit beta-like protein n=1 Tax=Prorocentrum cordatum TaxID=2364126 RepID=A0ABN9VT26_9DINO|nr:unnamed protein product [Polarella glacialis]
MGQETSFLGTSVPDPHHRCLEGHADFVVSVAFSPHDANILASGSWDRKVFLWDLTAGTVRQRLEGHAGWVLSVAFSPHDANVLASGSACGKLFLWDLTAGTVRQRLEGHADWVWSVVWSVAFSPHDANVLASGSTDGKVFLWDLTAGTVRQRLGGHAGGVLSVAFSPHDANVLASGSACGKLFLWDLTAGTVRQRLEGHADWMGRCSSGTSLLALSASASGGMRAGLGQWPSRHTTPTFLRVAVKMGRCSSGTSLRALSASACGSSDGKIVLCGAPVVNIILSVRFDVDSFSPYAAHVTEFLRKVYNVRVYNPNNFNKRYCGHDGCCVLSYGCQIAFDPTQTPTNSDCWQSSYRWHCEGRGSWCRANLPVVMLAIVEDGVLGPGQKTEKRMAEQMGIQRLEVHTKKLYIGQLGGAELDKALLDVANLLRGLKFI